MAIATIMQLPNVFSNYLNESELNVMFSLGNHVLKARSMAE